MSSFLAVRGRKKFLHRRSHADTKVGGSKQFLACYPPATQTARLAEGMDRKCKTLRHEDQDKDESESGRIREHKQEQDGVPHWDLFDSETENTSLPKKR